MFVLRSLFWLSTVVMLLPAAPDGQPAPRVSLLQTAYAAKILVQDVTGVCARHPEACATSREALHLLTMKIGTGAESSPPASPPDRRSTMPISIAARSPRPICSRTGRLSRRIARRSA